MGKHGGVRERRESIIGWWLERGWGDLHVCAYVCLYVCGALTESGLVV